MLKKDVWRIRKVHLLMIKTFMLNTLLLASVHAMAAAEKKVEWNETRSSMTGEVVIKDANSTAAGNTTSGNRAVQSEGQQSDQRREALARERNMLHQQLIETWNRYQKQNEDYRRLRLSIAATLASGEKHVVGKREDQLLESLAKVTEDGRQLALKAIEFCDYAEGLLRKLPLGQLQRAELTLRLDELRGESRKIWNLADPKAVRQTVNRCRLLAVDDDLRIVVLPVGSVHGVFNGLNFYVGKDCRLKIISVRPYVSAAVVDGGDIKELAPGMEATTNIENRK